MVAHAVVIGGGTMGAGITQVLLEHQVRVVLSEATDELAAKARTRVDDGVRRAAARAGGDGQAAAARALELLTVVTGLVEGESPADIVIEAVPESVPLKRDLLRRAQTAFPGALLATNTSSLSIDVLAGALGHPEALVGMHFFNPVPSSTLIEIVAGARTNPDTVKAAREWAARMGKESIEVRDSPGFATSRLGLAIGLEAIRMLESGVASAADIDRGMVLGYKYPIGPLELTDRIGLDVRLAIAEHLETELGPRFAPPRLLLDRVAAGHLGRKTGRGFYRWKDGRRLSEPSTDDAGRDQAG